MVMSEVLCNLNWKFVLVYVDDILVFSQNIQQHLSHLTLVFEKLKETGLKVKPSKCRFAAQEVAYLGHVITRDGFSVDKEKMEVVTDYQTPKNVRDLRAFLSLCNCCRRFVKGFAKIAHDLNALLQKDIPKWTESCEVAFNSLEKKLKSVHILAYPEFDRNFILYCDASDFSIGYILGQKNHERYEQIIAYGGRALSRQEKKWKITDREGLALVEGCDPIKTHQCHRGGTTQRYQSLTEGR